MLVLSLALLNLILAGFLLSVGDLGLSNLVLHVAAAYAGFAVTVDDRNFKKVD